VKALTLPALHEPSSGEASPMINVAQYLFAFAEACFQRLAPVKLFLFTLFQKQHFYDTVSFLVVISTANKLSE